MNLLDTLGKTIVEGAGFAGRSMVGAGKGVGRFAGKNIAEAGRSSGTKLLLGTALAGGMIKGIGSSPKEALLDAAFDDPNADEAFMGRPMSGRFLGAAGMGGGGAAVGMGIAGAVAGAALGGGMAGKIMEGSSFRGAAISAGIMGGMAMGAGAGGMGETLSVFGPAPTIGGQIGSTIAGTVLGGTIGSLAKGVKGGMIGGAIGAIAGAAAVPAMTANRINSNMGLLARSPYNTSTMQAQNLNASGNIVLGMHNSRGGY